MTTWRRHSVEALKPHNVKGFRRPNLKEGECYLDAYHMWINLKYIGNVVRGVRKGDRTNHYWLEVGNYIYTVGKSWKRGEDPSDLTTGEWVMVTYKKDIYYEHYEMKNLHKQSESESLLDILKMKLHGEWYE